MTFDVLQKTNKERKEIRNDFLHKQCEKPTRRKHGDVQ